MTSYPRSPALGLNLIKALAAAEEDDVLALQPSLVVIATGGLPNTGFLDAGGDLVA